MPITARLYNFAEAENDGKTILQGTQNICKMNCVQESGEKLHRGGGGIAIFSFYRDNLR